MKRKRLPKYVSAFRDRHGKTRYRFRRRGHADHYFHTDLWSDAFMEEYRACMAGRWVAHHAPATGRTKPGSIGALISAYYGSSEFQRLRDSTRATYRGILERFRDEHGHRSVAKLKRKHIKAILDGKASTPHAANNLLLRLRTIMHYAVEMEWRDDDPTISIKPLKTPKGGFYPWTHEDVAKFEKRHPEGTMARLALRLGMYTAQRRQSLYRLGWQHVKGDSILIEQGKTEKRLALPIHPELRAELGRHPKDRMTFLVTSFGQPFETGNGLYNWFKDRCREAGLPPQAAIHGLRHFTGAWLAEKGATPHQIKAVTGHDTLKEVERYTRTASQRTLSVQAIDLLIETDEEQEMSNLEEGLDNWPLSH